MIELTVLILFFLSSFIFFRKTTKKEEKIPFAPRVKHNQ